MADYSENVIDWYVGTREPLDKAGAYAVQGLGREPGPQVEGCFTNVVGLPICQIRRYLDGGGRAAPGRARLEHGLRRAVLPGRAVCVNV